MAKTRIEWAEVVWNPITGCTLISEGCQNCYARRMANRLRGRCGYPADDPFKVTLHKDRLEEPLRWKKPRRVFVCSMGDLFHEDVPFEFIASVFGVMANSLQNTYMVLTKRPQRMKEFFDWLYLSAASYYARDHRTVSYDDDRINVFIMKIASEYGINLDFMRKWPLFNVWLGVTAENQARADERIPILLQMPAAVRFVSVEPMLGPLDIYRWLRCHICSNNGSYYNPNSDEVEECHICSSEDPSLLDWVICGGETGPGARPVHPDWVRSLRNQCQDAGVPFFFKQWGEWAGITEGGVHPGDVCISEDGFIDTADEDYICFANESDGIHMRKVGKKRSGRLLDGRTWDEMPET